VPQTDTIGSSAVTPPKQGSLWSALGWGTLLFVAWGTVQGITAIFASGGLGAANMNEMTGRSIALANITATPVAVALAIVFARARWGMAATEHLGLTWPPLRQAIGWTLAFVGLLAANDLLSYILHRPESASVVSMYRTSGWLPVFVFGIVVAAPLGEEFIFRGFLFSGIATSRGGPLLAIAVTTIVFSALHTQYDALDILSVVAGAVLLGVTRWRTKSLWLCVALHSLMNAVAMVEAALFAK